MIRRMKNFWVVGSLILLTFLTSCLDNDFPDLSKQLALDVQKIEKHLTDNNITNYVQDPKGVFYVIHQQGIGALPLNGHHVNLTYEAKLLNSTNTLFEQTSIPVFLTVGNISIAGLSIALPKLAEGTTATVYIPSVLAYGSASSPTIPANSNLVVNVEIFDVVTNEPGILEVQKTTIDNYLLENEIEDIQTDPSGLRYVIHEEGTGEFPNEDSKISVKYKGTLLSNGREFDKSTSAVTFTLGAPAPSTLIEGWEKGFKLLKEGTKTTFYIPSGLGYGSQGVYNQANPDKSIPGHAILVFEIEFIEIVQ